MATTMRARFPVLLLLGIVFLASVSVTVGALAYWETENPCPGKCMQSCANENEEYRQKACDARCKLIQGGGGGRCRQQGEEQREQRPGQGRQRQRGEEQEEEEQPWRFPGEQPRGQQQQQQQESERERPRWEQEQEQEGQRGTRGKGQGRGQWGQEEEEDEEEEEEDERQPWGQRREEQERRRGEQQREERTWKIRGRELEEEEEEEEEEEWRGPGRRQDPEERERVREREREERRRREQEREQSQERQREETRRRREKEEQQQEREQGQGSRSPPRASRNNPFYFPSRRFRTRYGNQHGRIRVLQRFDQRSRQFQNLQNYRLVEIEARPNALVLPKHADADNILVVQQGQATVTLVNPNNRQTYNLESGDALRIPSGTISYILNRHDNQNLRVAKLSMPVNRPGQFEDFFPASSQDQPSYFRGFSRNTLEAAFNARFEEIRRILLEENQGQEKQPQRQPRRLQSQEEGVIVRVSREQIQELTRHAKSSPRRGTASESGPFNLRNRNPIYSNRFGRHFEVTPDRNPQLQDLDIFLSCVEINEGALMLPHYNSKAIVVLVVNQGRGSIELVGIREKQQQEEEEEEEDEEGNRQVRRYTATLSEGDIAVIPAAHPVAIKASSNLHLLGFGINAENNQRFFLAGESDNVINQIHRQVKELAFPGSGQEVERLIGNQRESHFVSAQPRQRDEGRQARRGPLSSILSAFY